MKKLFFRCMCVCLFLWAGCGKTTGSANRQGDAAGAVSVQPAIQVWDKNVSYPEKPYSELWNMSYRPGGNNGFAGSCRYELRDGGKTLLRYTSEGSEPEKIKLILPEGVSAEAECLAVDAVSKEQAAIRFRGEEQDTIVLFNKWGRAVWTVAMDKSYFPEGDFLWCSDGEGNQLIWDENEGELRAYGKDGKAAGSVLRCGETEKLTFLLHDEEGKILYSLEDFAGGGTRLFRYDFPGGKGELLMQETSIGWRFFGVSDGKLLYAVGNRLLWGAIGEKTAVQLLDLQAEDIREPEHVLLCENGELYLYAEGAGEKTVYAYSQKEQDGDKIRVYDFFQNNTYVAEQVKKLSRESGKKYVYESTGLSGGASVMETAWNRLMAEFAAGKGPDICIIGMSGRQKLQALYEKGALADLTSLVSEETRQTIFRGVLDAGTIDGKLVGLGTYGMVEFCVTSDAFGLGEHYTTAEVLECLEGMGQEDGLEGLYYGSGWLVGADVESGAAKNLHALLLKELGNSEFVDFEGKKCDFENPEFARILKICREYGQRSSGIAYRDVGDRLRAGSILGYWDVASSPYQVAQLYEICSDSASLNGFPNQVKGRGYWGLSMVVVNANSSHMEEIAEVLEALWSYDNQEGVEHYLPVRRDVFETNCYFSEAYRANVYRYRTSDGGYGWFIFQKPDGTGYREDFLDLLENCSMNSLEYDEVRNIIEEEANGFFEGGKPVEEVCRIIQNRVQLYLKERD